MMGFRIGVGSDTRARFGRLSGFLRRVFALLLLRLLGFVLLQQLADIRVAQCHRDSVDASLDAGSKVVRLQGILGPKFAGAFGDWAVSMDIH